MNSSLPNLRTGAAASILIALCLLIFTPHAQAQLDDAGEFLRAGAHDANLLMENYLKPFGAGFGADLNTGWVNTAHPYQRFGFDLRVNAALAFVPASDQLFSVAQLPFQQINNIQGPNTAPTISGDEIAGPTIGRVYQGEEIFSFELPQGTGFPYVPSPMVQLTVGTGFGTDLSFRYVPTIDVPDVADVGLWGIGLRHGINQWLPGGETLPVDLSVQAGYTKLTASAAFDVQPQVEPGTEVPAGMEPGSPHWNNQGVDLNASGFTANLLAGKSWPIFSLFGGVGFQTSSMNIDTPGNYPVTQPNTDTNGNLDLVNPRIVTSIASPIDLSLDGSNSVHLLGGFRIRLAIVTISASYTLANYPVANVGVGISLR